MECVNSQHGICQVASKLAHKPVPLDLKACEVCKRDIVPMSINKVTASIAVNIQRKAGIPIDNDLIHIASGKSSLAGYALERYIHRWLKFLHLKPPQNCGCEEWIIKMNQWGFQGSLNHIDEIVEHLSRSLKTLYSVPLITKPLISRMVRKCLLKELS